MEKMLVPCLIIIVVAIIVEWIRELCTFQIKHYNIQSTKIKNIKPRKILLLSDLHNCKYGKNNEKLLRAICEEAPDMILIAGDMLVGKQGVSTEVAKELVEKLPEICDTYYGNGNHEQRMKENVEKYNNAYEDYHTYLQKKGVVFLENDKVEMMWEDCPVNVWGLEIPRKSYEKFCKVSIPDGFIEDTLGKANDNKYNILIAHNPLFVKDYIEWGADLIVSGHLHGGVARIPFWRGVISPQGGLFPKYSGEMKREGNTSIVVSKGIGIHTIPIRFFNPAEIVVLHVGGSEE